MNAVMSNRQRGLTFSGFIVVAFLLILASIVGMRLIPAYMENAQINNLFTVIANDPDMRKATPRDIRNSFAKRANIDYVTAINSDEIEINKADGNLVLNAQYTVTKPLIGNISLLLEFSPSSEK